jgi:hypothetical protein
MLRVWIAHDGLFLRTIALSGAVAGLWFGIAVSLHLNQLCKVDFREVIQYGIKINPVSIGRKLDFMG